MFTSSYVVINTIFSVSNRANASKKASHISTIIKIESIREFKNSDKQTEKAVRYYMSSLKANPEDFQTAIRSHWSIENNLHWILDVAFSEHDSRKRTGNVTQNFSILIKIALNMFKKDTKATVVVKAEGSKQL